MENPKIGFEIGDLVQWESNNQLIFERPRRIMRIEKSEHGDYAFFLGSNTGIPTSELIHEKNRR